MSLNCSEINLILQEANLENAFIQSVVQSSYNTLSLGLYKTNALHLFFSLEGSDCRFHITKQGMRKSSKPLRFMELLRSRIIGYYIESAHQINADRIIKLVLKNVHEEKPLFLYIKLWTSASNIILTDENNIIIDAFYRRPNRNEVAKATYLEPIPISKLEIEEKLLKFPVRKLLDGKTLNETLDDFYATKEHGQLNSEVLKKEIIFFYTDKIGKLNDKKKQLTKQLNALEDPEVLKQMGSLLLMNIASIEPHSTIFKTTDYATNQPISIKLDSKKSVAENANDYFTKAKKTVSGRATIQESICAIESEIANLELAIKQAQEEADLASLKALSKKVQGNSVEKVLKTRNEKNYTGLRFNIEGFLVLVGRSATENDELLRHCVKGNDMWLHVRDYSGGYIFIRSQNKKSIPLNILIAAGNLAVYYSKAKKAEEAIVYYTQVKNLRRAKNAKLGTVLPENEKTLSIRLDKEILKKNELGRIL